MNLLKFHFDFKLDKLSMTIKSKCLIVSRDWSRSWLTLVHIDDKPETAGITIIVLQYENLVENHCKSIFRVFCFFCHIVIIHNG